MMSVKKLCLSVNLMFVSSADLLAVFLRREIISRCPASSVDDSLTLAWLNVVGIAIEQSLALYSTLVSRVRQITNVLWLWPSEQCRKF